MSFLETQWKSTSWSYLSLNEVCRDNLAPVPIEESQSRAEGGCRDTPKNGLSDDTPPVKLRLMNSYYGQVSYAG